MRSGSPRNVALLGWLLLHLVPDPQGDVKSRCLGDEGKNQDSFGIIKLWCGRSNTCCLPKGAIISLSLFAHAWCGWPSPRRSLLPKHRPTDQTDDHSSSTISTIWEHFSGENLFFAADTLNFGLTKTGESGQISHHIFHYLNSNIN